jgi:hypothetical protein
MKKADRYLSRMVRELPLGHIQPTAQAGGVKGLGYHCLKADGNFFGQVGNAALHAAVLIVPREVGKQIPKGENPQPA